jgi:hypothetical protein
MKKLLPFLKGLFHSRNAFQYEGVNAPLVQAMHTMASEDNRETRNRLYEALLASTLIIPTPELPEGLRASADRPAGSALRIDMVGFHDRQGRKITPAFTDTDALKTWDPNTPSIGLKAQALFEMVRGTEFQALVINPFDPIREMIRPGGIVTRAEIEVLANGIVPNFTGPKTAQFQLKANEKVLIGRPALPPSQAIEELLKKEARAFPAIAELYVFQMATQAGSSHTVIGISLSGDTARNRQDEITKSMMMSIQSELKSDQSLDFTFLSGSMLDQVRSLGTLIFRRP